jgi:hypothetical protein
MMDLEVRRKQNEEFIAPWRFNYVENRTKLDTKKLTLSSTVMVSSYPSPPGVMVGMKRIRGTFFASGGVLGAHLKARRAE